MNTNPNRIINLYLSDSNSNTWRGNLSRIIENVGSSGNTKLFNLEETTVSNDIDLLMSTAPKSPVTNNSWSEPVKAFTKTLTSSNLGNIVSSLASFGVNVLSSWNDVFVENGNENGRTARIFQPWTTNVQAWTGLRDTSGIAFEYEFKFAMGQYGLWNALEEVVKPIINLVAPAFPQYMDNTGMSGPLPSTSELLLRCLKNSVGSDATIESFGTTLSNEMGSITDSFKNNDSISGVVLNGLESIATIFKTLVANTYANLTYTIEFGKMIKFDKMTITEATTSFSNEVDNNGYPVSGTAKLTFTGLVPLALINATGYGETQMFNYTRYGGSN